MASAPYCYLSPEEDRSRWLGFPFRPGDIVISTRPKTGTTWLQMICALLIFQRPDPPGPLWHLSPWLDHMIQPREAVLAQLAAQRHRRFIKTHTPLDQIPFCHQAAYVVIARHPLDIFVSLWHQGANLDGGPDAGPDAQEPLHDCLLRWIAADEDPRAHPDSLPGVMWHLAGAWARRGWPNVILVRYEDLRTDLAGQMRWLAWRLGIGVPEPAWPVLVRAATFEGMRSRSDKLVPAVPGMFKDTAAFFRSGTSGAGAQVLSEAELARYYARAAQLAPPDLLSWLHAPPRA
jgi:aryl sulfotransferase